MTDETGPIDHDEPGLPGLPPAPAPAPATAAYRVLARKYRPQSFDDLIGQEAMVRTIANGFEAGRIPQAWMLTGVRGVGKTTTARILARALNYKVEGGTDRPTIAMPVPGVHCQAIMEGRHIDVQEIDAASNNGVENVRQLNDAVRYAPVSARYKVYIVDEVHMLSAGAFNAFLKTLEEPPPHAKFIFATTEIRKVPVTILSRCQRFDLRRVETGRLVAHLSRICAAEAVSAEDDALAAIARAAEGSVRDSLSMLDQAIAHGAGTVTAEAVRDMLGLADRARIIDLFDAVMRGDLPAALGLLRDQYDAGADPAAVVADLAAFTHLVTRLKLVPEASRDPALSEAERLRGADYAAALSIRVLSRAWQMLTRALPEIQTAAKPLPAAEMALVRLAYAADLPTPDEALRMLRDGSGAVGGSAVPAGSGAPSGGAQAQGMAAPSPRGGPGGGQAAQLSPQGSIQASARPSPRPEAEPGLRFARFEDLVAFAGEQRQIAMKAALERDVRLVRFEDGVLEFALADGASRTLAADIGRMLQQWTGRRWMVAVSSEAGQPTLREQAQAREAARASDAENHPAVRAALERFPGARIVDIRERAAEEPAEAEAAPLPPVPEPDDEDPFTLDD